MFAARRCAINAALTAQGAFDQLTQLWKTIATLSIIAPVEQVKNVETFVDDVEALGGDFLKAVGNTKIVNDWFRIGSKKALFALRGLYDSGPIHHLLGQILDANAVKSTLIVTATILTMEPLTRFITSRNADQPALEKFLAFRSPNPSYGMEAINYVSAVEASAAIPAAFQPVAMNLGKVGADYEYVDGGVANNTPVNVAVAAGSTDVYVVFLDPPSTAPALVPTANLYEIGLACLTVMQQKILQTDFEAAATAGVRLTSIRPASPLSVSVLGFADQPGLDAAFSLGAAAGGAVVVQ